MSVVLYVILAVVVVLLVVAIVAAVGMRRRRNLRNQFGGEYDRAVETAGSRRAAERELRERNERRNELDIKPLDPAAAAKYRAQWTDVQARFVDAPAESVSQAHSLLTMVMAERGYPVNDQDERASMLSVDHADVMDHYRAGMDVESRWRREGSADTEALRQAMQHYREVFNRVVGETDGATAYPAETTTTGTDERSQSALRRGR
ncbi:MAG: hypothetical protein QOD07_2583 [Frankiaceae bacterium]|jgi:hypothetical protein|nr:hypothetical protein [Frankiaceae bacterium]